MNRKLKIKTLIINQHVEIISEGLCKTGLKADGNSDLHH